MKFMVKIIHIIKFLYSITPILIIQRGPRFRIGHTCSKVLFFLVENLELSRA